MNPASLIFSCCVMFILSGCATHRHPAPLEVPECALDVAMQDVEGDTLFEQKEYTDWLPEKWWTMFNDPQLNDYIETALAKNPNLQAAEANIFSAVAAARKIRADLYPQINWEADVSRQKLSETGIIPFNPSGATTGTIPPLAPTSLGIPVYFTQYETEATLNYEFDLWNKNRNNLYAALGQVQASLADRAFTELQLTVAICKTYFLVQADYKRLEINQALVANKKRYLELTNLRATHHLGNLQTTYIAEGDLSNTEQELTEIKNNLAINEHQLKAYLAGNFDEVIDNIHIEKQPLPAVPLPKDLPLHLLAHRPDIISQLWVIESAGREIEVAKAGFYPDFNLTALFGFQTLHLHELFQYKSADFNIDPAISLPIFDGGRLRANLRSSEINYDLAIFEYNNRILNAVREVLDGISTVHNNHLQLIEFTKQASYQENVFKLTKRLVANNLASGLDDLNSENKMLIANDQEAIALSNTVQALLSLIKALGGGYETCFEEG